MILPISKQTEFTKLANERVDECLYTVNLSYGNILDIPNKRDIVLNYEYLKDNWMATASVHHGAKLVKNIISFNPIHVEEHINLLLDDIVPHELSHIICFSNDIDSDHGENWKALCIEMGGTGKEFV